MKGKNLKKGLEENRGIGFLMIIPSKKGGMGQDHSRNRQSFYGKISPKVPPKFNQESVSSPKSQGVSSGRPYVFRATCARYGK